SRVMSRSEFLFRNRIASLRSLAGVGSGWRGLMDDDLEKDDSADGGQLEQQVARFLPLLCGAPAQAPENEHELGDGESRNRENQPRPQTPDAGVAEQQQNG